MIVILPIEGAAVPSWEIYRNGTNLGIIERFGRRDRQFLAVPRYSGSGTSRKTSMLKASRWIIYMAVKKRRADRRRCKSRKECRR